MKAKRARRGRQSSRGCAFGESPAGMPAAAGAKGGRAAVVGVASADAFDGGLRARCRQLRGQCHQRHRCVRACWCCAHGARGLAHAGSSSGDRRASQRPPTVYERCGAVRWLEIALASVAVVGLAGCEVVTSVCVAVAASFDPWLSL